MEKNADPHLKPKVGLSLMGYALQQKRYDIGLYLLEHNVKFDSDCMRSLPGFVEYCIEQRGQVAVELMQKSTFSDASPRLFAGGLTFGEKMKKLIADIQDTHKSEYKLTL